LHFGELLEVRHQRAGDRVESPVRLATSHEIDMHYPICIGNLTIACETVQNKCESLVAFHITRALEVFVEHRADQVLRRGHEARRRHLIGELTFDQAVVICEINVHLHIERRPRS
jgi:hypothetical protein